MRIYYNQSKSDSTVMTLGTFDGVHSGHQEIIKLTIERAKELGCDSGLFTFDTHPLDVLFPLKAPKALTSWSQKRRVIEKFGVNKIILNKFTKDFSRIPAEEFILNYILKRFKTKEIIIGKDFRYGYRNQGTPQKLKRLGEKLGFGVNVVGFFKSNNKKISSTRVRSLIEKGKLNEAKEKLRRNFMIEAHVVGGDKRGRKLGFPTANLNPVVNYVLPPAGVYSCRVKVDNNTYLGVVHLGLRPTFAKGEFAIEVHIFDFSQNIYGKKVELEFVERIRGEENFSTSQELIEKIKEDIRVAKEQLKINN
ncbi:bifunctional riboflavin kinase/FAD synthetase [Halonatronum saccharophilum]|uniref:bifunctional riboflavin kinase/FAD synthetase n=1 Tax=Halonatronum saccharophilum TaxID=150060 RepID=UPI0004881E52|nr:bifunctional riboflavin kinase/FAD synthetase [Halonatronum saccharophilum]